MNIYEDILEVIKSNLSDEDKAVLITRILMEEKYFQKKEILESLEETLFLN